MLAVTFFIPAYAASISTPEPMLRFGIFAQVAGEDAGQLITRLGTSSEFGGTPPPMEQLLVPPAPSHMEWATLPGW